MIKKMINNNLYPISIIIIVLVFLSFTIVSGCKIQDEDQTIDEEETQVEREIEETAAPEEASPEVNDISVEEVYEIINSNQDYIILDVRTPDEFNEVHIKGAILIPVLELDNRLNEIPKDKPIITYCYSGSRSRNAANILVENGFKQVYDMGGILEWMEKGYPVFTIGEPAIELGIYPEVTPISVDESYEFLLNKDCIFLDVRSLEEYNQAHIKGAVLIPVSELKSRLGEIPKDKHIIVYCDGTACSRSDEAAVFLVENGFEKIYDMTGGGIFEWIEKGYPIASNGD